MEKNMFEDIVAEGNIVVIDDFWLCYASVGDQSVTISSAIFIFTRKIRI